MEIGVNFFGPKRKLYHDFEGTLEKLKAAGITSAELCVLFEGDEESQEELEKTLPANVVREMSGGIWPVAEADDRLAAVRAAGISVVSAHVMMGFSTEPSQIVRLIPTLIDFGKRNDIRYFVLSLMKGLEGMKAFIPAMREASDALSANGFQFVYHNHEVECMPEAGTTALQYLLDQCPNLKLELDVGWAKFAGADPVALMRAYRDRLVLLHFKDIRADASPETRDTCFTPVGEGSIPMREIMEEARHCPLDDRGLIIDQDDSLSDILEDLAIGAGNIRAYL